MQQIFKRKNLGFFWRSIFLKFCMQVAMVSNFTCIKSKKSRRIATLTYRHFGNPGCIYYRAHYTIVHKKAWPDWPELFFRPPNVRNYSSTAREWQSGRSHAVAAGGRALAVAIFFTLYIYNYGCHRYLHAKFQEDWPSKNPSFFHLKICCIVFDAPCRFFCRKGLKKMFFGVIKENKFINYPIFSQKRSSNPDFLWHQ